MLAALRNEEPEPDANDEILDEMHTRQTVGALLIGEAVYSLIETRKALRHIEAIAKALTKS